MNLQVSLLAVIPRNSVYTAYFFCTKNKIVLPLEISGETSRYLISCEQKILFDFHMNFPGTHKAQAVVTANLRVEKDFLENYGIKVSKKMLKKCILDL